MTTFNIASLFKHSLVAVGLFGLTACANTSQVELANKDKAVAVISSIETGDTNAIAYINPI